MFFACRAAGFASDRAGHGRRRRAPAAASRRRRGNPVSKLARACFRCCRPIPSPNTASILPSGKLAYTATAGTFSLFDQSGERSAAIFYTAFVAKPDDPRRPVTFVFNGGPGAGSAFLNLGLVGPRIAAFGNGYDGANVRLVDNPDTWLAFTDLVLIDPVGTGWSRPANPTAAARSGACIATPSCSPR